MPLLSLNKDASKNIIPNCVNFNTSETNPAAKFTKTRVQKTLYLLNYDKKRDIKS